MSGPWYVAILVAIITGVLGLVASGLSLVFTARTQGKQIELKDRLDRMAREEDAWRSYQFEARKRLYTDVRPLLFQIAEYSYLGRNRIIRVLRNEIRVRDKVGTTSLRIFAPLVLGRELQRRLTSVDLTLDPAVRAQYAVIREMLINLHAGRAIAKVEPRIPYHTNDEPRDRSNDEPRGHLTWAQLDRVIELFTVREEDGTTRPLRQGELDNMLASARTQETEEEPSDQGKEIEEKLRAVNVLFADLPPDSSRVLGRLLLAQSSFMHILIEMQASGARYIPESVLPVDADKIKWHNMEPQDVSAAEDTSEAASKHINSRRIGPRPPQRWTLPIYFLSERVVT